MSLRTSTSRLSRQSKLLRLGGALAVKAARDANDPDVKKMKKYKDLWKKYRDKVNRKYGTRGMIAARKTSR